MAHIVGYNKTTDTRPSHGLWNRCGAKSDPESWTELWEDFATFPVPIATDAVDGTGSGRDFTIVQDVNTAVAALQTDQVGGILQLTTGATDNEEIALVSGDNVAGFCKVQNGKQIFFEARVAWQQIVTHSSFVGLGEEALGAANLTVDGGTLGDVDLIGWQILEADVDALEPVYKTTSGTAVVVKADAQIIVAETYYKLGLWFDGLKMHWFLNGVDISACDVTYPVSYSATGFPDGEELAAYVSLKAHAAADMKMDVDWIKVAAEK
jgi:hypothetical protein